MAWLGPGWFDGVDQFTNSSVFGAHAQEYTHCRHFGTACFSIDAISQIAFQFAAIPWFLHYYGRLKPIPDISGKLRKN